MDEYSSTPNEIAKVMQNNRDKIKEISAAIQSLCKVPDKCNIPDLMMKDVDEDILNVVEKYLSINWSDKNIFIQDRDAYPIKLSATDEEESKVEQSAGLEEPLQTKALFFDNKKMIYKSKQCDGIVLRWKRKTTLRSKESFFKVRIFVNPKGNCVFKFSEYTSKEDIENVIFSIIGGKAAAN